MFLPANITLKFGDSGDFVSELQRRLATVHCFSADQVNGFFDGATVNGVSTFQSMNGLRADGIAGPETLRRLNGVLSGDTSSSGTNQAEEDELKRQEESARILAQQEAFARQQQAENERLATERATLEAQSHQQWQHAQAPQQPEIHYTQEAAYAPQQTQPEHHQQANEAVQQQLHVHQQQQLAQSQVMQSHELHQGQTQSIPTHSMPQQQPNLHPVHQPTHAAPAHHQPAPVQVIALQQQTAPQPHVVSLAPHPPASQPMAAQATEPAAAPRGMVGRAIQYANEMVQKLSNYFESKLSPDHLAAAKEAGLMLAKSGVREAAIPTGPEPQRGMDTPARGQQQVQQRG